MLLNQETLRIIFGLKLRNIRLEKNLSLKSLAKLSGLSPSYLNEIEKGKKYPKSEKILLLADSLGVDYDELISLKLNKELSEVASLMSDQKLAKALPFDVYGIPANTLFELMAENPKQSSGLVGAVLEIARARNLKIEDFFAATLRAYLDQNKNYLAAVEEKAVTFLEKYPEVNFDVLATILQKKYFYKIVESDFAHYPVLADELYFVFKDRKLLLNKALSEREKTYVLAKEIGQNWLALKQRFSSFPISSVDSYEVLAANMKASYFASAILIPKDRFVRETRDFFNQKQWSADQFKDWIQSYPGNHSSFMHRLSQILPNDFGLDKIFLLRFEGTGETDSVNMLDELHISQLHAPHRFSNREHYCRRWVSIGIMNEMLASKETLMVDCQRSQFSNCQYLNLSIAFRSELDFDRVESLTLGVLQNETTEQRIKFADDPAVTLRQVSDTCERCGILDCSMRVAPPAKFERKSKDELIRKTIDDLF